MTSYFWCPRCERKGVSARPRPHDRASLLVCRYCGWECWEDEVLGLFGERIREGPEMAQTQRALWEEAWERDKDRVAREMHEDWMRQMIAKGVAGHPFSPRHPVLMDKCAACELPREWHHPYMVDFDLLRDAYGAYNDEAGIVGYRLGFEAGYQQSSDDQGVNV